MLHSNRDVALEEPAASHRATEGNPGSRPGTWLWTAGLLVVVLLAANGKLLRGKAAPQWDAVDFFGPAYSLVADHVRAHRLLTWDPWTSGGTPDFAEPELGVTSPVMLLVAALFPKPSGFIVYWMLIWIAGALGMMVLARHLRCPPWGALVAALGFAASGFMEGHAEHTSSLFSIAFLPWICWRLDDALLRKRYWSAVQAGVLYGLSGLGGYPQFTILTPSFLALWGLGRIVANDAADEEPALKTERHKSRLVPAIAALLLVGVIGGLILCPPYLGFMTATHGYSDRVGPRSRVESISSNVLPAGALTTFASPYLFLLTYPELPGHLWPSSDLSMSSIYSGAVVTVLGLFALFHRSRWRYWLGLMAIFYLCCSLGNQLPLRGWLYDYVLVTRYFRNASMFSAYSIFLLCILAALAARDLERVIEPGSAEARKFLVLAFVVASVAGTSFVLIIHQSQVLPWRFDLAVVHLAMVWLGIVLAALLLVLHLIGVRRCTQILVALAMLDAFLGILIARPALYSSVTVSWWQDMDRKHVASLDLTQRGFSRQLNYPGAPVIAEPNDWNIPPKIAALSCYWPPLRNRFLEQLVLDPVLREFALSNNRTWFSDQTVQLPPSDNVYARFVDNAHRHRGPVLILHDPKQMNGLSPQNDAPSGRDSEGTSTASLEQIQPASLAGVELLSYRPDFLQFRYQAPRDGWVMITERWAPGWKAEVNGKPEDVYGADFLFRAVKVEGGTNTITLRYEPRTWLPSLVVSWGTLLLFCICEAVRIGRKKAAKARLMTPESAGIQHI